MRHPWYSDPERGPGAFKIPMKLVGKDQARPDHAECRDHVETGKTGTEPLKRLEKEQTRVFFKDNPYLSGQG